MSDLAAHDNPEGAPQGDDPSRRDFIHIATAAAAAGGAAAFAWPLIDQMNPSADTLALASTEFDLTKVAAAADHHKCAAAVLSGTARQEIDGRAKTPLSALKTPRPACG